MSGPNGEACRDCAHWRPHASRGDCLLSGHVSTTYRLVGSAGPSEIFEQTRPDEWCTLFEAAPPE